MTNQVRRINLRLVISLIFLSFFLVSCQKKKGMSLFNSGLKEVPVDVYVVKRVKSVPVEVEYPGMTHSYKEALVRARVSGILEKRFFKEGDFVKRGDLLFLIERDLYFAKYQSAKALVDQAKAQFEEAKKTWERIKKSYQAHLVSKETRDKAYYQFELAKANYQMAKARLKEAKILLDYTEVKAPISGIAGERKVDVGNLVSPGAPLVKIQQVDPIYVNFAIPDEDVAKYQFLNKKSRNYLKNLRVKIILPNGRPYALLGRIDYVASSLEKGIPALKVRAVFPNHNEEVLPNLFVRVELVGVKKRDVMLVPKRSVLYDPEGEKVFVVKNGRAEVRFIKVCGEYKGFYLVKSGLKPGDAVIVDNLLRIISGTKVKIDGIVEE